MAGCADEDDGGGAGGKDGGKNGGAAPEGVAFFGFAKANSFTAATFEGVEKQARKEGTEAEFFDAEFDAQTQVQQIQDAVTSQRFDVFVVQAVDGGAVVPAVRAALREDIAVVVEFTPVGTAYDTAAPQVDGAISLVDVPVENGRRLGELGAGACADRGADTCQVAYLEGLKTLPLDNARTDAVVDALEAESGVEVVARVEGGYTRESGRTAMQDIMQAHPDVDVVIGSSQAVLGAEAAADGKDIAYVGNGASRQAVAAVEEGRWYGIPYLPVTTSGAKAAELGLAHARGEDVPASTDMASLAEKEGVYTKKDITSLGIKGEYDD
ncbi:sugar ABC transporter substrate-binding protein [Streptomyces sp. WMMC500]|uniref:sugar ABC transporter substrate-binding protein n=1 Tax=Streptomyces sp. WMMC500 TaxID=3015154 RepID=UPI00248CCFEA|nr:sugar ABC transporter substrate-binding protein [Streptomyces sp. WMMC500]WBB58323.1 sugar ABC transporter substrate-binding protein [Streptomyces sp. WMMC500]